MKGKMNISTKYKILKSCIFPALTYETQTWWALTRRQIWKLKVTKHPFSCIPYCPLIQSSFHLITCSRRITTFQIGIGKSQYRLLTLHMRCTFTITYYDNPPGVQISVTMAAGNKFSYVNEFFFS